jgi:hypothetical protein
MPRKKPPDSGQPAAEFSGDPLIIKAELQELRELGLADRIELQTRIISGDLVLREAVALAIGRVFGVYRNILLTLDESYGEVIGGILGVPEGERHSVRNIISDFEYGAINELKKKLEAVIKNS